MANRGKITREEPNGPLRKGLQANAKVLGPAHGGRVFAAAYDLANTGLDVVLDLENMGLGNSDKSIPPPFHTVALSREQQPSGREVIGRL